MRMDYGLNLKNYNSVCLTNIPAVPLPHTPEADVVVRRAVKPTVTTPVKYATAIGRSLTPIKELPESQELLRPLF